MKLRTLLRIIADMDLDDSIWIHDEHTLVFSQSDTDFETYPQSFKEIEHVMDSSGGGEFVLSLYEGEK